jgi:hypothetical protein
MNPAEKLDLYKLHKGEYLAPKKPMLVEIKPANYLTISGQGGPGGETFTSRIGALYGMAYTIKMTSKAAGRDYVVCKLEGLWWSDDPTCDFAKVPKDKWQWKLLIRTPDFVDKQDLRQAAQVLTKRGKSANVELVALETIDERLCVQMLHVGPYDKEGATIRAMNSFAEAQGLVLHGLHHEIYLSDPRRVVPERLRTILRHPVTKRPSG